MKKCFEVDGYVITIIYESLEAKLPLIVINTDNENIDEIYNNVKEICDKGFIIACISNVNWNKDMSPWFMPRLFKGEDDYSGGADLYIEHLTRIIMPRINNEINNMASDFILAGYSLAGLFSIYSLYKTGMFNKVVSCSGSMWYPDFLEYVLNNSMVLLPERVYLSLGNLEAHTRNPLMKEVLNKTIVVRNHFIDLGIDTIYEENEGNHFKDVSLRIAKGIKAILE